MYFKGFFIFQVSILMSILAYVMAYTCPLGNYIVVEQNGTLIMCKICVHCPPSYGVNVPCNSVIFYHNMNFACNICDLGKTYSSENNERQCQPCKSTRCYQNEEVVGVCTRRKDNTQCNGTCVKGYYWSSKNRTEPCQPCKSTTCHRSEEMVGMCTLKQDNTRCNGTCIKGYYWSKNPTEPCQLCKSITCHRNEEMVGMCTLKQDNTQCNGTCIKGYYWSSKNPTEPCQPCKNITCHCNEEIVGMCTLKQDNTRCNGTCIKGYYWSKNPTEPCQPCKNITCHHNEEMVGMCTLKQDNTQCNGTCVKGYYWSSKNRTEPCQPLYHRDSSGDRNATPAIDKKESPDGNVIAIVVSIVVITFLIAVFCVILRCCCRLQSCSKYVRCRSQADDEARNIPLPASHAINIQEQEPLCNCSESPHSVSVPGGTHPKHGGINLSSEPKCKVATFKIGQLVPDTHRKFCQLLDISRALGGDYRTLAGKLGYDTTDVTLFAKNNQPTEEMLLDWSREPLNTVLSLMVIVKDMNRYDPFMLLHNELQVLQCSCGKCPEIPSMHAAALTGSCETTGV